MVSVNSRSSPRSVTPAPFRNHASDGSGGRPLRATMRHDRGGDKDPSVGQKVRGSRFLVSPSEGRNLPPRTRPSRIVRDIVVAAVGVGRHPFCFSSTSPGPGRSCRCSFTNPERGGAHTASSPRVVAAVAAMLVLQMSSALGAPQSQQWTGQAGGPDAGHRADRPPVLPARRLAGPGRRGRHDQPDARRQPGRRVLHRDDQVPQPEQPRPDRRRDRGPPRDPRRTARCSGSSRTARRPVPSPRRSRTRRRPPRWPSGCSAVSSARPTRPAPPRSTPPRRR